MLIFDYEFSSDDDDFGLLSASVETPDFSGNNRAYVQWQDLLDLEADLARFPISANDPVLAEWGFGEQRVDVPVTRLSIAPAGPAGDLLAEITLANWDHPERNLRTTFRTDYPALARFREAIGTMIRDRSTNAVLAGYRGAQD